MRQDFRRTDDRCSATTNSFSLSGFTILSPPGSIAQVRRSTVRTTPRSVRELKMLGMAISDDRSGPVLARPPRLVGGTAHDGAGEGYENPHRRSGQVLQMNRLPRPNVSRGDGRKDQQHGCHEGADCGVGPVEAVVRGLHGDGLGDYLRRGLVGR